MMRAAILFLAAGPAWGFNQALNAGQHGAGLGAGGAVGAERSAYGRNPAALLPGHAGFHMHFHRPFGLEELSVAEAGLFWDRTRWGAGIDWRQTGAEALYREQGFTVTQTLRWGAPGGGFPGVLDAGAGWTGWRVEMPGREPAVAWSQGFGAIWRLPPRLKAGAFALGLPVGIRKGQGYDRVLQWGVEACNRDPEKAGQSTLQVLRLDFRKSGETPWRSLASLSFDPHPAFRIAAGLAHPPFQIAFGIRVRWQGLELDQALRHHRYLGKTWLSGLAYSRSRLATAQRTALLARRTAILARP
jgi:hypothetical protein